MPMNPRRPISATSSRGTSLCSSMSFARGRTFSRANSRAVRWMSSCSGVSVRSKPVVVSVLVVVAMPVLQRVDADVPAIGIAREEVVAEELRRGGGSGSRAVECRAHILDAEPDDEARLFRDLRRGLAILGVMHDDLGVLGLEPRGIVAGLAGDSEDLGVEALHAPAVGREHHHRADLRLVALA